MEQWLFDALKKMDSYPPSLVKHITEQGHEVWCVFIFGIGNVLHNDYIALQTDRFRIEKEQQNQCTQPYLVQKDANNYVWDFSENNIDNQYSVTSSLDNNMTVFFKDSNNISDEELGELLVGMDWNTEIKKPHKVNPLLSEFSKTRARIQGRFVKEGH
jgi:hypothetical protein